MRRFYPTTFMVGFLIAFFFPSLAQRIIDNALENQRILEEVQRHFQESIQILAYGEPRPTPEPWAWIDHLKSLNHPVDREWIAEYERKRHRRTSNA